MHFIGALTAAPLAWLLHRTLDRSMVVRPLSWNRLLSCSSGFKQTLHRTYESGREFVLRAGTVIFAMSIVIWALLYFPRPESLNKNILPKTTLKG